MLAKKSVTSDMASSMASNMESDSLRETRNRSVICLLICFAFQLGLAQLQLGGNHPLSQYRRALFVGSLVCFSGVITASVHYHRHSRNRL